MSAMRVDVWTEAISKVTYVQCMKLIISKTIDRVDLCR